MRRTAIGLAVLGLLAAGTIGMAAALRAGVVPAGSLWRPAETGSFPAVVLRTPYDRTSYAGWSLLVTSRSLAYLATAEAGCIRTI